MAMSTEPAGQAWQVCKYPKTPHLPFSPGVASDDVVLTGGEKLPIVSEEIVVTEKLDGGNCSIHRGKVYARTVTSEATHLSFGPVKQLASQLSYLLPDNLQLFGENMFGVHSIEYDGLSAYFYLFGVLKNGADWLSWDQVTELAEELGVPTVPLVEHIQAASMKDLQLLITQEMSHKSRCGSCSPEGFVVRTVRGFPYGDLEGHVAKYVRSGHVQTADSWRRTWKQAKLKH